MTLNDDGDIVKALGYLAFYAAYVEEAIDECLLKLTPHDPNPPKKLQRFPTSQKIAYIKLRLDSKKLTQELTHFPDLLDTLIDLFDERNEFIHGRIYGSLQGKSDILRPGRPAGTEREVSSRELIDLANLFFKALSPLNQAAYHSFHRYLHDS